MTDDPKIPRPRRALTPRQRAALELLARGHVYHVRLVLARQLEARGLVALAGPPRRWTATLTALGRTVRAVVAHGDRSLSALVEALR